MKNKFLITITLICNILHNSSTILCRSQSDLLSPEDKILLKKIKQREETNEFESKYFDTKFLSNPSQVETALLKEENFEKHRVTTFDTLQIMTFAKLSTKQNERTIISAPGFFPGRAAGMATLYSMFKNTGDFNFMFIENRSHGESDGPTLSSNLITSRTAIRNYGKKEYLDIVASIESIVTHNKQHNITSPILLHGVCAGAHSSIKALAYLKKHNPKAYQTVDGIVFDSGWAHVSDIAENTIVAEKKFSCLKSPYTRLIADWILEPAANIALLAIYKIWFKSYHTPQQSITELIKEIDKPILFIHAENDRHVPIQTIQPLMANAPYKSTWIVPTSKHACIHLKQKEEYQQQVLNFIEQIDQKNRKK